MARAALLLMALGLGACTLDTVNQAAGNYINDLMEGDPEEVHEPLPLDEDFEPSAEVLELWSTSVGALGGGQSLKLAPVAAHDKVFMADPDGEVRALGLADGEESWERDTEVSISAGPSLGEGLVLVGTPDGQVLALKQGDGRLAWKTSVSSEVLAPPRIADGVAVVRTVDGKLFGLDAGSGRRLWVFDRQVPVLTLRGTSAPVIADGRVVAGFDSGSLVALDLESGKPLWEARIAQPKGRSDLERMVDIDAEPVVAGDTVYVVTYQGRLAALSLETGQSQWDVEVSSYAGIGIDDEQLYLTDAVSQVWGLVRYSGDVAWEQEGLAYRSLTAPRSAGDYVVVGDLEGYVHWLTRKKGRLAARVEVGSGPITVAPLVVDDVVIAYSATGELAAYRAQ